jgi:hypothetical protein
VSEKVAAAGGAATPSLTVYTMPREEEEKMPKQMTKKPNEKYWEHETPEIIEFGNSFMRCYDKAGKLQFGSKIRDRESGGWSYVVKFVIDRKELFSDDQAASYLRGTIDDWEEMLEVEREGE